MVMCLDISLCDGVLSAGGHLPVGRVFFFSCASNTSQLWVGRLLLVHFCFTQLKGM